jgi:ribonuclease HI
MVDVIAFTDGGCRGNPGGVGAWAFVLIDPETRRTLERADAVQSTTNNRMELQAAIEALRAVRKQGSRILVCSDSKYLINCCTKWMNGWKAQSWQRKESPLKNVELLQQLDILLAQHAVDWRWVPGHVGNVGNERADQLANEAMDRLVCGATPGWEQRGTWASALLEHEVQLARRTR